MNINYDTLFLMSKFGLIMIGLLLLVYLLAVATPKLAKIVDKILGKTPVADVNETIPKDENGKPIYEVHSIYEGNPREKDIVTENDDIVV